MALIASPAFAVEEPKERLVVMQVQGRGVSPDERRIYRNAVVEALSGKYYVLSGDDVDATVQEIFEKESRENIECDTEKCFQDIAIAFQAELIATTTVLKSSGGYMLTVQINNVLENEALFTKSEPCKGCDQFQIINVLKAMAGGKVSGSALPGTTAAPSQSSLNPEAEMWGLIKDTINAQDIRDFLVSFPNGKMASVAKLKLKQLERQSSSASTASSQAKRSSTTSTQTSAPEGMVFVKGGCFEMGDTFGDGSSDEKPVHRVCVSDFKMDKYEVTQSNYQKVMGNNPSKFKGSNNPVEKVSWHDAKNYCEKVGKRLPTEAEWEYAARSGGKKEKYAGSSNLDSVAWYRNNSGKKTHSVGQKQPNGLGLYDMSGNVWEWVSDWYGRDYYRQSPRDNPKGASNGKDRVLRGGAWYIGPELVRASYRNRIIPGTRGNNLGFRCSQ